MKPLALLFVLLVGCAVPPAGTKADPSLTAPATPTAAVTSGSDVPFTDEGATVRSGYSGQSPKVEMRRSGDRWLITVYQGQQRSGGHAIRVERVTAGGTILHIRARFTTPAPDAITTAELTSPAHTIGIGFAPDSILLFDQDDRERARSGQP